ncbi:MAG: hypothetical protein K0U37_05835 [Gammaproteobacteria bacterium]|nr:hypothetical protein [Gammaproteobacteria bacterium]
MLKKSGWMLGVFILFFSFNVYAKSCNHDVDCSGWESDNCVCGVHAKCRGVTNQNTIGKCQCFGAEGACHSSSSSSIRIRGANRVQRTAPVKQDAKDTRIQTTD